MVNDKQSDKQQAYEILKEMELASNDVGIRINKVREKIELIAQNPIDPKDEPNGFVAQVPLSDSL